jgi:hypothetical protein
MYKHVLMPIDRSDISRNAIKALRLPVATVRRRDVIDPTSLRSIEDREREFAARYVRVDDQPAGRACDGIFKPSHGRGELSVRYRFIAAFDACKRRGGVETAAKPPLTRGGADGTLAR